jgi:pimeloyl-ACP methyl ester carboxylesterase
VRFIILIYCFFFTPSFILIFQLLVLQGMPYPDQELNAIDIVMQFAIHGLKFQPENILLFGWSIGGYPTSWAAMNYPDVKGVVCILIHII